MKAPKIHQALVAASLFPALLSAQTVFTDTFENRTAGTQLHNSTSSDGNADWIVEFNSGLNRPKVTTESDSGNNFVRSTIDDAPSTARARDTSNNQIHESDFRLEMDYYYLQSFDDNRDFRIQYRLQNDFNDLDNGGILPGYRVRLKADNSATSQDSVRWFIETDPNAAGSNLLASGNFDVSNFIVAGDTTPGSPLSVVLEVNDDNHKLTLNGTNVADITDSQFNNAAQGAMNFKLIQNRNKGFDNVTLTAIPEPSMASVVLGLMGALLVWRRGRIRHSA